MSSSSVQHVSSLSNSQQQTANQQTKGVIDQLREQIETPKVWGFGCFAIIIILLITIFYGRPLNCDTLDHLPVGAELVDDGKLEDGTCIAITFRTSWSSWDECHYATNVPAGKCMCRVRQCVGPRCDSQRKAEVEVSNCTVTESNNCSSLDHLPVGAELVDNGKLEDGTCIAVTFWTVWSSWDQMHHFGTKIPAGECMRRVRQCVGPKCDPQKTVDVEIRNCFADLSWWSLLWYCGITSLGVVCISAICTNRK